MGFNIPYTHSEERPSRALMTKSAMAGAQTLLLYPAGPDARRAGHRGDQADRGDRVAGGRARPVLRGGRRSRWSTAPKPLPLERRRSPPARSGWRDAGQAADLGLHQHGRERAVRRRGVRDHHGAGPDGVHHARGDRRARGDGARGPAHRPGRRGRARRLDRRAHVPGRHPARGRDEAARRRWTAEHGVPSVAFEMLGPPRLTKLLFEAHLLVAAHAERGVALAASDAGPAGEGSAGAGGSRPGAARRDPVGRDPDPLPGREGDVPRGRRWWCRRPRATRWRRRRAAGWTCGRPTPRCGSSGPRRSCAQAEERRARRAGSGSDEEWFGVNPVEPIAPWRLATWIFRHEDKGERIKR